MYLCPFHKVELVLSAVQKLKKVCQKVKKKIYKSSKFNYLSSNLLHYTISILARQSRIRRAALSTMTPAAVTSVRGDRNSFGSTR